MSEHEIDEREMKKLKKLNERYNKQNKAIREKYDRVSATLPKGTIDRIRNLGLSVNGVINKSVLSFLEYIEEERKEELERLEAPTEHEETHQIDSLEEQTDETTQGEQNHEEVANNDSKTNHMTLAEAQALLDRKRAEQKEREEMLEKARQERKEQEKAEMKKVINEAIESIRNQEEEQ